MYKRRVTTRFRKNQRGLAMTLSKQTPQPVVVVTKKRKRKVGNRILRLPRNFPPERIECTLLYSERLAGAAVAGATTWTYITYRSASLYDPLYSASGMTQYGEAGGNAQADWFDIIKGWYRAVIVPKTTFYITVLNQTTGPMSHQMICGNTDSAGPINETENWFAMGANYKREYLIANDDAGESSRTYKFTVDNYKVCGAGKADARLTQANPLVATSTSNPSLGPLVQFKMKASDSGVATACAISVKIVFHCQFFDKSPAVGQDA